jgi:arylformamidase
MPIKPLLQEKFKSPELIDISQPIGKETAPWPGDVPFRREWNARIEEGSSVTLGAFQMSAHLGTHADAPLHFQENGSSVDQLSLHAFCGPALVVRVDGDAIRPDHVDSLDLESAPRVLFKTRASNVEETAWSDDFPPILPETIRTLAEAGAVLVGTDAPSVDPADSQDLPAHHALARHGLCNLENLALAEADPGRYVLFAPPLRLRGMDAAPVRAVLLREKRPEADHTAQ